MSAIPNINIWIPVVFLISVFGCTPSHFRDDDLQALHNAARSNNIAALELLIKKVGNVDATDSQGRTLLYCSSLNGYLDFVKVLLKKGADPLHKVSWKDDQSALHASAAQGHIEVMKLLLDAGVNVDIETGHGETPLMYAARNTRPNAVVFLLAQGADISHKDSKGKTVLHDILASKHKGDLRRTIKAVYDAGAEVNAKSVIGETPLMQMCQNNNVEGVQTLLEYGANPAAQNKYGVSVLQYATNNIEIRRVIEDSLKR